MFSVSALSLLHFCFPCMSLVGSGRPNYLCKMRNGNFCQPLHKATCHLKCFMILFFPDRSLVYIALLSAIVVNCDCISELQKTFKGWHLKRCRQSTLRHLGNFSLRARLKKSPLPMVRVLLPDNWQRRKKYRDVTMWGYGMSAHRDILDC